MPDDILSWFSSQGYLPHSYCLLKNPGIMALHVVSDALIALSYFTIPVALTLFFKRRADLKFSNIFVLFAAFILACATTHLFDIWTLWQPDYLAQGLVKAVTASVSLATAIMIWPTLNRALSLPSHSQLTAASAAKTQFLAHMSHEIRTPMNAVLGMAQMLEREALSPEQAAMVHQIRESGDLLLHIINDILDLSKIEAGQLRFDRQPFDLASLLAHMGQLFMGLTESKGITFQIHDGATHLGCLIGDSLRLEQILMNLTSNAIKFTEQGGVVLEVAPLRVEETSATLRFTVRDTGIGISREAQAKLFQAFSQADASITRRFGGTGLGLAISKRLVELMGGRLDVVSEPGQGSTFWFVISLDRATDHDSLPINTLPGTRSGQRLTGLRALAVDDNRINLFMLQRALELEGATVTLANDGQQGLDALRASPRAFDIVLMDIQMPVLDGLSATRTLRGEPELADMPVIALTAGVLAEEREAALAAGMSGFLVKPLDLEQMVAVLRAYVPAATVDEK